MKYCELSIYIKVDKHGVQIKECVDGEGNYLELPFEVRAR